MKNHPRRPEDALLRVAQRARLLDGAVRAADQVLLLALDPEVRRIVGDVRKYGYEWASRKRARKAFPQRAIEVRHKRNDHIRLRFFPMRFEQANCGTMIQAYHALQDPHQLRASQRPAVAQHQIVKILYADARIFLEDVERVQQLL